MSSLITPFCNETTAVFGPRSILQSWAEESVNLLQEPGLKPPRLAGLDARGNEIWRILFRIADQAGGEWPQRARAAALALSGKDRRQQDASGSVQLLGHIRDLFAAERMSCSAVIEGLNDDEQLPYGGWSDGKGISTRELGKKLAAYKIKAKTIRLGERTAKGYERAQFEDAWSRYLPDSALERDTRDTTRSQRQETAITKETHDADVPLSEKGENPHGNSDVPLVPLSMPELGQEAPEWERDWWRRRLGEEPAA